MVKVLITGCGGYIGTTLIPYLLRKGYAVRCVDWLIFGDDILSHVTGERGFELVKADVRNMSPEVFRGVDVVVDLAAISNDPTGELVPELTWEVNYKARERTASIAKIMGSRMYILASSASVYGRFKGVADENTEPNPLTVYARANLEAEKATLKLSDKNFNVIALRFSTAYGPSRRMRFDLVVNTMTLTAFQEGRIYVEGDGSQYRPLVHVFDIARAVALILEAPGDSVSGQVFNVGSEEQNYRIIDIAREVQKVVGGDIIFRGEVDRRSYRVSFSKIRSLGYSPIYTVSDGIKQVYQELLLGHLKPEDRWFTVKWYRRVLGL